MGWTNFTPSPPEMADPPPPPLKKIWRPCMLPVLTREHTRAFKNPSILVVKKIVIWCSGKIMLEY
jgi:hypothetical protein